MFAVDHLMSYLATRHFLVPNIGTQDTRVFGHFNTRYPGIRICGYLQSLGKILLIDVNLKLS